MGPIYLYWSFPLDNQEEHACDHGCCEGQRRYSKRELILIRKQCARPLSHPDTVLIEPLPRSCIARALHRSRRLEPERYGGCYDQSWEDEIKPQEERRLRYSGGIWRVWWREVILRGVLVPGIPQLE